MWWTWGATASTSSGSIFTNGPRDGPVVWCPTPGQARRRCSRWRLQSGSDGAVWHTSIHRDDAVCSLARRRANVVGKPYEGKPHVRFDVAGGGNQHLGARRHSLTLRAPRARAIHSAAAPRETLGPP